MNTVKMLRFLPKKSDFVRRNTKLSANALQVLDS
jgi:hypothetical protein